MNDVPRAFVYLQLPGSAASPGEWVTVGTITPDQGSQKGRFVYATKFLEHKDALAVDPIGLPRLDRSPYLAQRYGGLVDVVRDASPDGWGKHLLIREGKATEQTSDFDIALLASNSDRWGALCLGRNRNPSVAHTRTPPLSSLNDLLEEIDLLQRFEPARHARLRRALLDRSSIGGARPKVTLRDGQRWLLAKPLDRNDPMDVPRLEHLTMQLASKSGLRVARTKHRGSDIGAQKKWSVVLVDRFDRDGDQRIMAVSGATLMEVEYPATAGNRREPGYLRLADSLRRIGCPDDDLRELWFRMIFNILVGNDDDHPRNHAAIYVHDEKRWRLSPAFDIVPNPVQRTDHQAIQVAVETRKVSRQAITGNASRFGIHADSAVEQLDAFCALVKANANAMDECDEKGLLAEYIRTGIALLS